jgi:tRNA A-37 threonylcarbamoyl transferase component Bud32
MASPDRPNYRYVQKDQVNLDLSNFDRAPVSIELDNSNTNTVETIRDKRTNALYVKRTLRHGENSLSQLIHRLTEEEFPAVGFGGQVHGRSMREQLEHIQKASELGLAVPIPFGADEQTLIYTYVPGETLSSQLKDGKSEAITPALASLADAHEKNIIHGDPYPGNFIVQDDGKVMRIDFDVALTGEYAKELELSQFLWAVCNQTTDIEIMANIVRTFAQTHPQPKYDWHQVSAFMTKYEMYLIRFSNGEPRLGEKLDIITSAFA